MQPITALFFGSQGAGKGTQVKLLKDFLASHPSDRGLIHIDMGVELRALRDSGSVIGGLTGGVIDQGARMPDFMPIYLQTKRIAESYTGAEHIIADGLARGKDQTNAFIDLVSFLGRGPLHVIDLVISEDTAVQRLLARGRNDDTEEAIRKRLAWTKTDVLPQLELLRERGASIHVIDGEPDVDTIHASILAELGLA